MKNAEGMATRCSRTLIIILLLIGRLTKEHPQLLLEFGTVLLDSLDSLGDLLQAQLLIGLVRAVGVLFVAVLLNVLATVSNLIEAQCSRGALQKVAQSGQLTEILLLT